MAYRVELYLWVVEQAPSQGAAILSLERLPRRCRIAPESFEPHQPVRVLNYGRGPHVYRVFFTIDETTKVVRVVHIRRGARQRPSPGECLGRWVSNTGPVAEP